MTPFIVLYFIPIGLIAIVIIAIIRLIIRAASNKDNRQTYQPPPPPPGSYNTGNNPYNPNQGTNPYVQNPYQQTPPDFNQNPQQQPNWQNPGQYQQPDYTQQNYTQPNYTQPNYTQPDYTQPGTYQNPGINQPPPGTPRRSTSIPTGYATQIPDAPQKSNAGKIAAIIIGVVVLLVGGIVAFIMANKNEGGGLTGSSFELAYQNPTGNTYYIILDEWDTIKVEPYTSTDDLDYTFFRDVQEFHWKMTTEDGSVIADTTVSRSDLEEWQNDRSSYTYINSLIIFNPSRSEFVYYTAWYDEVGTDYMDDFKVGDSTYFADAYVTNDAFIFDERDPEYITSLSEASEYSTDEQNQFLVSAADFEVLYSKLNGGNSQSEIFTAYREQLLDLFTYAREEVMANSNYDADDVITLYDLDSVTPGPVDQYTEPQDFVAAIEFVQNNAKLFRATAPDQYKYIVDSADVVLKHSYVEQPRGSGYQEMRLISYIVHRDGMFDDQPRREVAYEYDRDPETGDISYE